MQSRSGSGAVVKTLRPRLAATRWFHPQLQPLCDGRGLPFSIGPTSGNIHPTARWAQHRLQAPRRRCLGQAGTLAAVSAEINLTFWSETVPRPVDRISRLTRAGGWLLDAAAIGPRPRRAGCGEPGLEARPRHGSARCCGPALDDTDTADPYRRYRPDHRSARPAHRVPRRLSNRHGHWCRTEFNQILIRPDGEVRWTGTSPHPHHSQNRSLNQ